MLGSDREIADRIIRAAGYDISMDWSEKSTTEMLWIQIIWTPTTQSWTVPERTYVVDFDSLHSYKNGNIFRQKATEILISVAFLIAFFGEMWYNTNNKKLRWWVIF